VERRVINPWTWQDQLGFVQANEVTGAQRTLFCSGQTSVDENGAPQHDGDMAAQIRLAMDNVETVLKAAGMDLSHLVRLNVYTTDVDQFLRSYSVVGERLGGAQSRFASTLLGVQRLAFPQLMVELEAIAVA
jgi:enamine deaminase RidA (YjgF/YER057c/UK114 family)